VTRIVIEAMIEETLAGEIMIDAKEVRHTLTACQPV
jgi:hypothetical protein